jgi:hypothetical protein
MLGTIRGLSGPESDAPRENLAPGEKLVPVTCPGGTIHIEEIADANSASCSVHA